MNGIGELQNKIIQYLAMDPDLSKTKIAEGLGYTHPGNVSKQISALETKQLVKVTSSYMVRGSNRENWSLTAQGISYFIEQSDYSIQELINIITKHKEHESAELLYIIIENLEKMGISSKRVFGSYFQNNELLFSSIKKTGNSLLILEEMIVREIWEAPTYEKVIGDSNSNEEIFFLRNIDEPYELEQIKEDIFDWVLRVHVDKIDEFDIFARNCTKHFPLVFNDWNGIKQHGLDIWVKKVLETVIKHIHIKTIEKITTNTITRYTHQDFIEDLYTYIYGPLLFNPNNTKEQISYTKLKKYVNNTPEVKQFIVKRIEKNKYCFEHKQNELESYEKRIIHTTSH